MRTEAEAWREIARKIAESGMGEYEGLCDCVWGLYADLEITLETRRAMHRRVNAHNNVDPQGIWGYDYETDSGPWAFAPGDAEPRILAALFLALEAEDGVVYDETLGYLA